MLRSPYLLLCASVLAAPSAGAQEAPSKRLDTLLAELDAKREALHVPGLAIAVVRDDQMILAEGLGLADLERERPVTAETIFAIGSTSKAFTSTLIGMSDAIDWDDEITAFLPWFDLALDTEDETLEVTIRDLLSHRTGFTRMGVLWANGRTSREEILRTAVRAEPWDGFRDDFHYNNVITWPRARPWGRPRARAGTRSSSRTCWSPWGWSPPPAPWRRRRRTSGWPGATSGRRGSHATSSFRCATSTTSPRRVRSTRTSSTWPSGCGCSWPAESTTGRPWSRRRSWRTPGNPRSAWVPGVEYGLGWMLREWQGREVIEHGGNIDGFAAQVALLPSEDLGFVLLANVTATPLQGGSIDLVFDALVGASGEEAGTAAAFAAAELDFEPYLGEYVGNFAHFDDATFTVLEQNGHLSVDVPGQQVYELEAPDEQGQWEFALRAIKILPRDRAFLILHVHTPNLKTLRYQADAFCGIR